MNSSHGVNDFTRKSFCIYTRFVAFLSGRKVSKAPFLRQYILQICYAFLFWRDMNRNLCGTDKHEALGKGIYFRKLRPLHPRHDDMMRTALAIHKNLTIDHFLAHSSEGTLKILITSQ